MKKKLAVLLLAGTMVAAFTACGEKTPTLADIQAGVSEVSYTTIEASGNINISAEAKLDNIGDETQQVIDLVGEMYGVDLSKKMDASIDMDFSMEGEQSDEVSHNVVDYSMKIDSSVDALLDSMDETSQKATREQYSDGDTVYYTEDDGDTWYYKDEDSEDNGDSSAILDLLVSIDSRADEDNKIEVVATEDGRYMIAADTVINQEYAENLTKDEKNDLQDILDENNVDIDLDDLWDMYDDYGDYMDLEIPLSIELYYINAGDKKNPEYRLDEASIAVGGSISIDWDEDMVQDLANDAGAPMDFECTLTASVKLSMDMDAKFGYDEVDVDIPSKVENNAVEESYAVVDYDVDVDYTIDDPYGYDIDDDVNTGSDVTVELYDDTTGRRLYTLTNYEDMEIFNFAVPNGFEYDSTYSSSTMHFLEGDRMSLTVQCTVPAGIYAYYMEESDDYYAEQAEKFEFVENFTTNGNPYGYDIYYRAEYEEYYAVFVGDEYTSLVVDFTSFADSDALTDLENALTDGF